MTDNRDPSTLSLTGARKFADKYASASSEKQLGQSFWRDFFTMVVGIEDLMGAGIEFEYPVRSASGAINFVDVLWPEVMLIEQKSQGKNLDEAEKQARDYLVALPNALRPPSLVMSDFKRVRLVEVLAGQTHEFALETLPDNLDRLELLIGKHASAATKPETSADQKAVELMANLFVEFEKAGYGGHELSVFLVRILFLNFGDDTRMWKRTSRGLFGDLVDASSPDGQGVGGSLQELFQVLNTPVEKRPGTLPPALADFPYVNGGLFSEVLPVFTFTPTMRDAIVATTHYDWSKISPAIFGAMFQTVKSKEERRSLGEHFTSEVNILKVIRPLFLDEFQERLQKAWDSPTALKKFHRELAEYNFLDPACGSGNFLVVAYKRLREIELRLVARLQELEGKQGDVFLDGRMGLSISLDQFHGIEINEWSAQIATVAMYLADHQANLAMEEVTGYAPNAFPLTRSAHIHSGNALRIDWQDLLRIDEKTLIFGNPPFIGQTYQDASQKDDTRFVWRNHKKTGVMDFVSNWFLLAARAVSERGGRVGFVATNSLSQGEQVPPLWQSFRQMGVQIDFAHQTFAWSNEARGKAAVHVIIVGFSREKSGIRKKSLWVYQTPRSKPQHLQVPEINPYLVPGPAVAVESRSQPISPDLPPMYWGSKATDDGNLSKISPAEASDIREKDKVASKYLRRIIGAQELINGVERYCLWLEKASPADLRSSPEIRRRVDAVRRFRSESVASLTRKNSRIPHLFVQIAQPSTSYIAVPCVSSETRSYVPMDYFPSEVIANNALLTIPNAGLDVFAVLMSRAFNLWNSVVSGRLESRFRISQEITYNNFPLPPLSSEQRSELEVCGKAILEARQRYSEASLADLYGPTSMPLDLRKSHEANDKAVSRALGLKYEASDEMVLSRLFTLYVDLTGGLIQSESVKST